MSAKEFLTERISLRTLMETEYPRAPSIIGGDLLDKGERLLVTGEQKVGKSFLAYQIALCAAGGYSFLGFPTENCRPRKVLIINAEVRKPRLQQRFSKQLQPYEDFVKDNIHIIFPSAQIKIDDTTTQKAVSNFVNDNDIDLVIFDPLANLIQEDENTSQGMGHVTAGLDAIISSTGCAVILVHHHNKAAANAAIGHRVRGHSSLAGWYDNHFALSWDKREDLTRKLEFECRNREEPEPIIVGMNDDCLFVPASDLDIAEKNFEKAMRGEL